MAFHGRVRDKVFPDGPAKVWANAVMFDPAKHAAQPQAGAPSTA
jgi:hypothetical protein